MSLLYTWQWHGRESLLLKLPLFTQKNITMIWYWKQDRSSRIKLHRRCSRTFYRPSRLWKKLMVYAIIWALIMNSFQINEDTVRPQESGNAKKVDRVVCPSTNTKMQMIDVYRYRKAHLSIRAMAQSKEMMEVLKWPPAVLLRAR